MRFANVIILCFFSSFVAAQVHQHGSGEVLVVQEDSQWHIQVTLSAADVFGFEHEPESDTQKAHAASQIKLLEKAMNVVALPKGCEPVSYKVDADIGSDDHEDAHEAEHEEEHHEGHHEEHDEHDGHEDEHDEVHEEHFDVDIELTLKCENSIESITLNLFSVLNSLEHLDVLWTIEKGQGSQEVSGSNPVVEF